MDADGFRVPYTKDKVKDAPDIDASEISQETEADLYTYYGLQYSERRSGTGLPEGRTGRGKTRTDDQASVTRHEEELAVGKRSVDAGTVRLRKWVETEPVETDVELERETATISRQPVNQPVSDADLTEDDVEVPLRAEEAVVGKQTVAKERVSLQKGKTTERQRVADEVQKEHIEVDTGGDVTVAEGDELDRDIR
jgi:uncharacterized protein (TIGR02271 family)